MMAFPGTLWGDFFLPVIRTQEFSWYDFASFDNSSSAKLGQWGKSIRQKKEHVFATSRCSSWRRSERYRGFYAPLRSVLNSRPPDD